MTAIPLAAGEVFRPARDPAALRHRLAGHGFPASYLLYIGNTQPHKTVRRLLRAYARVVREVATTPPLVLGGLDDVRDRDGGPCPARVAAERGIAGRVRLLGVMTDGELADAYNGALVDLVVDAGMLVEPRDTGAIVAGLKRLIEDAELRAAAFSWERTADAILGVLLEAAR